MQKFVNLFLILSLSSCVSENKSPVPRSNSPFQTVVSYHPIATRIGEQILDEGGNAFDAFVATTLAEYVLSEGVTSLGGPLGALLYSAKTKVAYYMDAGFNDPLNSSISAKSPGPGEAALVPGAIAGLEAISQVYGRLSFKKVIEPSLLLARNGFVVNRLFANILRSPAYQVILQRSEYAKETFYPKGIAIKEGAKLKLPVLADFLTHLSDEGSAYAYHGEWAKKFVAIVEKNGGHLSLRELSDYKVIWWVPPHIRYRDTEIYSTAGRTYGGLNTLLALEALERADLKDFGAHYSSSASGLELLVRIENEVKSEAWLKDTTSLDNIHSVTAGLSPENAETIWNRVQKKIKLKTPLLPPPAEGSHSYQVVVIDKEGNAITGTNTIESMPWAQGIFVEGVVLTGARSLKYYRTKPGERRLSGLSMQFGIKDDKISFMSGAFGSSLIPASFQFIVNIIDYKMSARDAANTPRFGDDAWNLNMLSYKSLGALWLDPRVGKEIVDALLKRNLKFLQTGVVDTGLGSIAIVQKDGRIDHAVAAQIGMSPVVHIGIGVILVAQDKSILIKKVVANTEASLTRKVLDGDELLAFQSQPTSTWVTARGQKVEDILVQMRGAEGVPISLKLLRNSKEYVVTLLRGKYNY